MCWDSTATFLSMRNRFRGHLLFLPYCSHGVVFGFRSQLYFISFSHTSKIVVFPRVCVSIFSYLFYRFHMFALHGLAVRVMIGQIRFGVSRAYQAEIAIRLILSGLLTRRILEPNNQGG